MGGALSAPLISGVLAGCQARKVAPEDLVLLSPEQFFTVDAITDRIIPRTDTPGASDVGVAGFIDLIVAEVYDEKGRNRFLKGLNDFETMVQTQHQKAFHELEVAQQDQILQEAENKALETKAAPGEKPFFSEMKELTLAGYFTSEEGAKQALNYVQVPGRYEGCIPYEGKAWAV